MLLMNLNFLVGGVLRLLGRVGFVLRGVWVGPCVYGCSAVRKGGRGEGGWLFETLPRIYEGLTLNVRSERAHITILEGDPAGEMPVHPDDGLGL